MFNKVNCFIKKYSENFVMFLLVFMHLIFVAFLQLHVRIGGDGIFTYTLANNPYAYVYIDPEYKYFPENNGWINAHILRESYVVEDYDQFNYSAVYFHQRLDNHPLAYYFLIHTISSIFCGVYSSLWSMSVNLLFVIATDVLMIKFFKKIYNEKYYIVAFISLFLLLVMQKLYILPRMYMMLGFCCLWYLYIHYELIVSNFGKWKKGQLIQLIICIILGSQTHYYFYVYVAPLTMFVLVYLFYKREIYKLLNYIYSGIIGIAVSWIVFPWVIWHIFFNQMQKHTTIQSWSIDKVKGYIEFLNQNLFNGRGCIAIVVIIVIMIWGVIGTKCKKIEKNEQNMFFIMTFVNTVLFSVIIYTLDESVWYYSTPLYLSFVLLFSVGVINLIKRSIKYEGKEWLTILLSVVCVMLILSLSSVLTFVAEYLEESEVDVAYRKTASEYKGFDCIFVEKEQDNLFSDNFLVLGDYDEFKKIPIEGFKRNGIQEKDLLGRQSNSGLIIYIPVECEVPKEQNYLYLSGNSNYNIYMIEEEQFN